MPFAHSLAASSFLIARTNPVHVELRRKIKMDNRKVFAHTDKVVIGDKQSYSSSSSSSSSVQSAMTTASKREWSIVDEKDYATEDVPNATKEKATTTINNENAHPNEKRAIDDLRDGFLPLSKPRRSFVGTR